MVGVRGGGCEGWCEVLRGTGWHSEWSVRGDMVEGIGCVY